MMESISLLLFKPGFTVNPLPHGTIFDLYGFDEKIIWKAGVNIAYTDNHNVTKYDQHRIMLLRLLITIMSQPLYYAPDEYLMVLNPFSTYFTNRRQKNVKNLYLSLVNTIISYDCAGYGVPYLSSIDNYGEPELLANLSIHLLLILLEYKPPSIENLTYLIEGGHVPLNKVKAYFQTQDGKDHDAEQVLKDLTINEHFRITKGLHGNINLDPLYHGLANYFQNIVDSNNTYLPQSITIVPFY